MTWKPRVLIGLFAAVLLVATVSCGEDDLTEARAAGLLSGTTIAAAGDIATSASNDTATSNLVIALNPSNVLVLGDNVYEDGTLAQYKQLYDPTWGRFKTKTFPSAGNHDWHVANAQGYQDYFGTTPTLHSKVMGDWLVVSIDSEKNQSTQATQLTNLLKSDSHKCELVFWHKPRFSSGTVHGSNSRMQVLWAAAVNGGVDVVLNGHVHNYERFAQMSATGAPSTSGAREFVVGTGGAKLYDFISSPVANSQVRLKAFGVLKMVLGATSYEWEFRKVGSGTGTVADSGTTACH